MKGLAGGFEFSDGTSLLLLGVAKGETADPVGAVFSEQEEFFSVFSPTDKDSDIDCILDSVDIVLAAGGNERLVVTESGR